MKLKYLLKKLAFKKKPTPYLKEKIIDLINADRAANKNLKSIY